MAVNSKAPARTDVTAIPTKNVVNELANTVGAAVYIYGIPTTTSPELTPAAATDTTDVPLVMMDTPAVSPWPNSCRTVTRANRSLILIVSALRPRRGERAAFSAARFHAPGRGFAWPGFQPGSSR